MEECGFRRPACHGPRGMFLDKLEECCTLVAAAGTEASDELADCADSSLAPADSSTLAGSASHLMSIGAGPSSASAGDGLARPKGSGVRSGEPVPTIETQGTPSAAGAAPGAVVMFRSWVIVVRRSKKFDSQC